MGLESCSQEGRAGTLLQGPGFLPSPGQSPGGLCLWVVGLHVLRGLGKWQERARGWCTDLDPGLGGEGGGKRREADGREPLQDPLQDPEPREEGSGYQQGHGLHPLCRGKSGSIPLCGGLWGHCTLERMIEGQGLRPQKGPWSSQGAQPLSRRWWGWSGEQGGRGQGHRRAPEDKDGELV